MCNDKGVVLSVHMKTQVSLQWRSIRSRPVLDSMRCELGRFLTWTTGTHLLGDVDSELVVGTCCSHLAIPQVFTGPSLYAMSSPHGYLQGEGCMHKYTATVHDMLNNRQLSGLRICADWLPPAASGGFRMAAAASDTRTGTRLSRHPVPKPTGGKLICACACAFANVLASA